METHKRKAKLTEFGKQVKYRLIDLGRTQEWLQEQTREKTGLFMDGAYLYKVMTGERNAPKIKNAICEILGLEEG